jgi:hypothetical protein
MDHPWLGLIELGVVLLFALGWGILELVCLRLDRRREAEKRQAGRDTEPTP